jgi:predicted nucleic acid-binding protein
MKYVLDASVAIKWVLPEPDSSKALSLRDDFQRRIHELIAPDTLAVEVAHALTRAERRNILQPGEAAIRLSRILSFPPDLQPYLSLLPRAVELSSQLRIGVYDCLYVALAERESCQLITADQRLVNSLGGASVLALSTL